MRIETSKYMAQLGCKALNYLFRRHFNLALVAIILVFVCSPSWGSISDVGQEKPPFLSAVHFQHFPPRYPLLSKNNEGKKSKNARSRSSGDSERWQHMSPEEKESIKKKYREWQSLPPEEKQKIRQRMDQLNKMPPQKRELYRQMFLQWQNLSPGERRKLQKDLENWEKLSPQQQNSIRRRFKK